MNYLVAIVGPTAAGKSNLALRLAQAFGGEIVSADSRQVDRHMDIGTAKPDAEALSLVRHHLIGVVNPDEDFTLAHYHGLAAAAISDIQQRDRLPLLVGGSGLYVWSMLEGWSMPQVSPDPEFRYNLEERAAAAGAEELHRELAKVDPVMAQQIDGRNVRRVIRALEVHSKTGLPPSQLRHREAPPYRVLIIGLTGDRTELYRRIDLRVDDMVGRGLVAEVERLVNMGYDMNLPSMSGIGYRQVGLFLKGEISLAAAVQQTKFETHRFVRQQY
ncbi:MAG: tRNA (adenosine(37)-N6)-dimethylallyltransferase MiaA, partial [Chloroflexota bacterium]